jgi:hypothetical protein
MKRYKLPRTGRAPIRFEGDLIASAGTPDGKRQHAIGIHQTKAGKLIAHVIYATEWPRETGRDTVFIEQAWPALVEQLASYRAGNDVTGFPAGEQFRQQEAITRREIQDNYDSLLSTICEELDWIEEVD